MSPRTEAPRDTVRRLIAVATAGPVEIRRLSDADLDLLLRLTRRARLLGRMAEQFQADDLLESLPTAAIDQLKSALVTARSRARVIEWEMNRVARAIDHGDAIEILALKGCAYLLHELPHARSRMIADVDLMVAEQDLAKVERRLLARDWQTSELSPYDDNYYRKWTHELPPMVHNQREVEVDLHHNIVPRTARLEPDSKLLLQDACPVDRSRFKTLAGCDMTLHAMTHLMFDSDMADALRDLVDIDDLMRHFSARDDGFWDALIERAELLDLNRPAFYALRYAKRLLGTPVPTPVMQTIGRRGPVQSVVWLMDRLVPRALLPQHPDHPSRMAKTARLLLYMRSHWLRMPPIMLARHLAYKFYVRHLRGRLTGPAQT